MVERRKQKTKKKKKKKKLLSQSTLWEQFLFFSASTKPIFSIPQGRGSEKRSTVKVKSSKSHPQQGGRDLGWGWREIQPCHSLAAWHSPNHDGKRGRDQGVHLFERKKKHIRIWERKISHKINQANMKSEQLSIFPPFSQSKDSTASQEKRKRKRKKFWDFGWKKSNIFWYLWCDAKNDLNQKKGNQKSCSEK